MTTSTSVPHDTNKMVDFLTAMEMNDAFKEEEKNQKISVIEVLQNKALKSIFSSKSHGNMAVKGGIAMRILAPSVMRHTNDIDLSINPEIPFYSLKNRMNKVIKEVLSTGMIDSVSIKEDFGENSVCPKWIISGKITGTETKVSLKLEVSRRDTLSENQLNDIQYTPSNTVDKSGAFVIKTYTPIMMAASKVSALDGRDRPRDLYDLYVLITSLEVEAPIQELAQFGREKLERFKSRLSNQIDALTFESYQSELEPSLYREAAELIDKDHWNEIQTKVWLVVDEWLDNALKLTDDYVDEFKVESPKKNKRNLF